ncbi:hypothetical protein M9H77_02443 [Catharanthus roseus]|uniref:Uncharacterized protein n=1 Tax=Catharanthus roseus TaxID=4058 RepID=A0ACC0C8G6_CATRO|nr:hypothetical protein M9H77_02443 [Catharanthus roseus]
MTSFRQTTWHPTAVAFLAAVAFAEELPRYAADVVASICTEKNRESGVCRGAFTTLSSQRWHSQRNWRGVALLRGGTSPSYRGIESRDFLEKKGLAALMLSLFAVLKKQPSNAPIYYSRRISLNQSVPLERRFTFGRLIPSVDWICRAVHVTEEEILERCGLDVLIFIRLFKFGGGERNPVAVSMPHLNSLSGRLGETYVNYPQIDMGCDALTG